VPEDTKAHEEELTRYLSEELSNKLKLLGFDPSCPVYEISLDFEPSLLEEALFQSTYKKPILLPLEIIERTEHFPLDWDVPMVVESVQAVYLPYAVGVGETPTGCYERPEWFVRGFLYKSGFDPYLQVVRINLYCQTQANDDGRFDLGFLQVVRNPSAVNPDTPLRWGYGAPGQPE
jgi:hypothetical protein